MAFVLPDKGGHVDVAIKFDDALDMTEAEYDAYIEHPIPDNLKLKPGKTPTFLRMRRVLPWKLAKQVEDMKLGMNIDRDGDQVKQNMVPKLSWMYEEVRCSLVDIINPPNATHEVKFERDAEGGASHDLASALLEMGVMMDLWNARKNAVKQAAKSQEVDKKK